MTHDYAKPSTTRKPGQAKKKNGHSDHPPARTPASKQKRKQSSAKIEPPPQKSSRKPLFIISLALLSGAFIYGLYVLQSIPETHSVVVEPPKKASRTTSLTEPAPQKTIEQRFNFYDLLPEHEVVAPKVDTYKFKDRAAETDFYYIIQTGSFRNYQDAERQKAMIAFQGIKTNIQSVTNDQGTTWHRVTTEPFHNRSKMNSALDKLASIQIQPLVKKVKKSS